jgi:hypothetical protein
MEHFSRAASNRWLRQIQRVEDPGYYVVLTSKQLLGAAGVQITERRLIERRCFHDSTIPIKDIWLFPLGRRFVGQLTG